MNYRSIADLNRDVRKWSTQLPDDLDLIVGVPRSGLLAANLLALHKNLPLTDVEGLCSGRILSSGRRLASNGGSEERRKLRALVVDDSMLSGIEMRKVRERVIASDLPHRIEYAVVYLNASQLEKVDFWFEAVPVPRCFEWNILHHRVIESSCMDIDGVLCRDPTEQENDDGGRYLDFIRGVGPKYIPTRNVGALVTCRLEKYREPTEEWLERHDVKYDRLFMMDFPDKASRIAAGSHAEYKAEIYRDTGAQLFIESSTRQAERIVELTGKPVFCTDLWEMIEPGRLPAAKRGTLEYIRQIFRAPLPLSAPPRIARQMRSKLRNWFANVQRRLR